MSTPSVSTRLLTYDPKSKNLVGELSDLGLRGFPREIEVVSHHTERRMRFKFDDAAARRNEFWDGELAEYAPIGNTKHNVERLVLLND